MKTALPLLAILLVALATRSVFFPLESTWFDESLYAWNTKMVLENPPNIFSKEVLENHPPLMYMLAAPLALFTEPLTAVRAISIAFALFGVLLLYLLGRDLFGEFPAALAAMFLAFSAVHVLLSARGLLDIPFATLFTLTAYSLLRYERGLKGGAWLLAISVILTILIKRVGVVVLLFVFLYILYLKLSNSNIKKPRIATFCVTFILMALAVFFLFTTNFMTKEPVHLTDNLVKSAVLFVGNLMSVASMQLFPFFILGLIVLALSRPRGTVLLLAWLLTFTLSIFYDISESRFIIPALPVILLISALPIGSLKIPNAKLNTPLVTMFALLVAVFGMVPMMSSSTYSYSFTGFQEAGTWIAANTPEDAVIYQGSLREIRLFSGREFARFGGTLRTFPPTLEEFEAQLAVAGADVYIIRDIWQPKYQPSYLSQIEKDAVLVHEVVRRPSVHDTKIPVISIYKYPPAK